MGPTLTATVANPRGVCATYTSLVLSSSFHTLSLPLSLPSYLPFPSFYSLLHSPSLSPRSLCSDAENLQGSNEAVVHREKEKDGRQWREKEGVRRSLSSHLRGSGNHGRHNRSTGLSLSLSTSFSYFHIIILTSVSGRSATIFAEAPQLHFSEP